MTRSQALADTLSRKSLAPEAGAKLLMFYFKTQTHAPLNTKTTRPANATNLPTGTYHTVTNHCASGRRSEQCPRPGDTSLQKSGER